MLEFEVLVDQNIFIDLNFLIEFACKISKNNDGDLRTGTATTLYFIYFQKCTVSANGVKVSNTNRKYEQKPFMEQNFCQERLQKTQSYFVRDIITRTRQPKLVSTTLARTT